MSTKPLVNVTSNYLRGGGILRLAERASAAVNSAIYGLRDPGDVSSVTLSRDTGNTPWQESRSGQFQTAFNPKTTDNSTITANLASMTIDNFAVFMGADVESRTVSATPVTDEVLYRAEPGGAWPIGRSNTYPEGIRDVTSVDALTIQGGTWAMSTVYAVGDVVNDGAGTPQVHVCTVGGTSGGTEPTWASGGSTVTDSGVTWKHLGPAALVDGTDFQKDLTTGAEIAIVATGTTFATTMGRMPSGYYLNLLLDYTPVAATYKRLKPLSATKTYYVDFKGNAADGNAMNWCAPYCTATGTGDSEWINAEAPQQFQVIFSALKLDSANEPIIPTAGNETYLG